MLVSEFDRFADEYAELHARNVRISGETADYFAAYKIADLRRELDERRFEPATILDLGAGVGNSVPHFRRHFPNSMLICLDVSMRSLAVARQRFPSMADYILFDGSRMPLSDSSIDVGFAACVFHHVSSAARPDLLAEFRRVLRPGGVLCLFEHNPFNPLTVAAVTTCPFDAGAELVSPGAMRSLFQNAGFCDLRRRYRLFFPRMLRSLRKYDRLLASFPLGAQYYMLGEKPARPDGVTISEHTSI
jgi:ubiquinone/menaquinone biosynthesis C-methylase UbiE